MRRSCAPCAILPVAGYPPCPDQNGVDENMKWIVSPGHGWLVVPVARVRASGAQISKFSWVTPGGMAYLEEDCDADAFLDAAGLSPQQRDEIPVSYLKGEPRSRWRGTPVMA